MASEVTTPTDEPGGAGDDDGTGARATPDHRPRRGRRVATGALAVLAVLGLLVSTLALWSHRLLLNTDAWVDAVGPLAEDPEITDPLAQELTDLVLQTIDAEQLAEDALPEQAQFLAGPLTNAVQGFVTDAAEAVLSSEQFETLWRDANRIAHEKAVELLRGGDGPIQVTDGVVTLDLLPLVSRVLLRVQDLAPGLFDDTVPEISFGTDPDEARAELSAAIGRDLPDGFGTIELFSSDSLAAVQQAVSLFDTLVWVLPVVTLALLAGALALSEHRRRLLVRVGVGTVAVMLLATAIVRALRNQILGLIGDQDAREAARATIAALLGELRFFATVLLVLGAIAAVVAYLSGDGRVAAAVRARARQLGDRTGEAMARSGVASDPLPWVRDNLAGLQLAGVAAAVAVLVLGNPTWGTFLLVAVVLGAYEVALWFLAGRPGDGAGPPSATPAGAAAADG